MSQDAVSELLQQQKLANWRALRLFSGYRLFLSATLFFTHFFALPPVFLGQANSFLYSFISLTYLVGAFALFMLAVQANKEQPSHVSFQLIFDVVAITLILHLSGGLQTGLGALLLVVVVAGGTLVPGRLAMFIAATATIAILVEVSYATFTSQSEVDYSQAGILGATFFLTAWLSQWLSAKILTSQLVAEARERDAANLAELNQNIISRLQIGILVVDAHGMVKMFNQSAKELLGFSQQVSEFNLKESVPELGEQLSLWHQHRLNAFKPFQAAKPLPEVTTSICKLDSGEVLLYIENTSALAQQAQQLKLASLGRLTASIAHEIRNPLGAISHAGELLAEKAPENQAIQKLTDIIQRHSHRVNTIIETILQMSRRKSVEPVVIILDAWLANFVTEFIELKSASAQKIKVDLSDALIKVMMDPEQLHQVVWNLMENAWFYSVETQGQPSIIIKVAMSGTIVNLDIIDNGPGVSDKVLENLFEPFRSERQGGTGLGLYLARELCEANGARLDYLSDSQHQSCFRISFPIDRQDTIS